MDERRPPGRRTRDRRPVEPGGRHVGERLLAARRHVTADAVGIGAVEPGRSGTGPRDRSRPPALRRARGSSGGSSGLVPERLVHRIVEPGLLLHPRIAVRDVDEHAGSGPESNGRRSPGPGPPGLPQRRRGTALPRLDVRAELTTRSAIVEGAVVHGGDCAPTLPDTPNVPAARAARYVTLPACRRRGGGGARRMGRGLGLALVRGGGPGRGRWQRSASRGRASPRPRRRWAATPRARPQLEPSHARGTGRSRSSRPPPSSWPHRPAPTRRSSWRGGAGTPEAPVAALALHVALALAAALVASAADRALVKALDPPRHGRGTLPGAALSTVSPARPPRRASVPRPAPSGRLPLGRAPPLTA